MPSLPPLQADPEPSERISAAHAAIARGDNLSARRLAALLSSDPDPAARAEGASLAAALAPDTAAVGLAVATAILFVVVVATYVF